MSTVGQIDDTFNRWVTALPKSWRSGMKLVSYFGSPGTIAVVGITGFSSALAHHDKQLAKALLLSAAAMFLILLLKELKGRSRPSRQIVKTLGINSYSFPSGHAANSAILYGLVAYLSLNNSPERVDLLISTILLLAILMIGISRVYLGLHYASDVIGGWLLGSLSLFLVIWLSFY